MGPLLSKLCPREHKPYTLPFLTPLVKKDTAKVHSSQVQMSRSGATKI